MQIAPEILARHMELAAADQIASEYRDNGYEVETDAAVDGLRADLIARRGDEVHVFEFKSARWPDTRVRDVKQLRKYVVDQLKGRFFLVLAPQADPVQIEVPEMESVLENLAPEHLDEGVSRLVPRPYHYWVSDVEYEAARIQEDEVELKGTGLLVVSETREAQGDGFSHLESGNETYLAFAFHLRLDAGLTPVDVIELRLVEEELLDDADGQTP